MPRWRRAAHDGATRHRGLVIMYAIGTLVLVASVVGAMLDTSILELDLAKRRLYLQMARMAADSGIEYGMGVIDHELALLPTFTDAGGPWYNPDYAPPLSALFNWMRADTLLVGGETNPEVLEATPVRLTQRPLVGTSGTVIITQFQLALWPELNYTTARMATVDDTDPTLFHLRSRGEIIIDPDPTDAVPGDIMAQATVVQTFMVLGPTGVCPLTPVGSRQVWEPDPTGPNLTRIPFNVH